MVTVLYIKLRKLLWLVKSAILKLFLISLGCKVGKNLKCKQFPIFRSIPRKNISIGNNVTIGYRITFDVSNRGKLSIGNYTNLTQDIMISSNTSVEIGDNTLIAENVSIRDSDHGTKKNSIIQTQESVSLPIQIKDDVWLGAGVRVLKGSFISRGCVIAANSIVLSKSKTLDFQIYGGIPVKKIGERI